MLVNINTLPPVTLKINLLSNTCGCGYICRHYFITRYYSFNLHKGDLEEDGKFFIEYRTRSDRFRKMEIKAIVIDRTLIVVLCVTICTIVTILMQRTGVFEYYALKPFAPFINEREFSVSSVVSSVLLYHS